ncbi:hypothetical protein COY05_02875 [Candidatus Peregrinibacteria bacterium CG_4_10_14_0_2_um_filter_38_24]|nr:MAG: hypothetical protein COY05_02875 [Candidatus Peregrinibacteria bacterium CG_4_10_14_0_2_um_filter_38_24]
MNNTITTDGRQNMAVISPIWQNPAPVSRPCGREDGSSSKTDLLNNKNIHSSKMALLTDENLYALCKTYGERARIWRQRFAGLLPEVFKRKLYEKKGFHSIFEFAKKLAGMSEEQVRLVLNLEKRFETMPALRSLLTTGKVSVNKLSRIVSIATNKNEMFLANQVQVLSKNAVETLVRDEKFAMGNEKENDNKNGILDVNFGHKSGKKLDGDFADFVSQNSSQEPLFAPKSLPGQMCFDTKNAKSNSHSSINSEADSATDPSTEKDENISVENPNNCAGKSNPLNLSAEVQEKLLKLQQKGLDVNELLKEFLQKREEEIAQRKAEIGRKIMEEMEEKQINSWQDNSENSTKNLPINSPTNIPQTALPANGSAKHQKSASPSPSRHIPISIKRILYLEHGTKCSIRNCQKLSEQIHHVRRFSAVPSHDPRYLAPLCKAHHELMHCKDLDYIEIRKRA